MKHVSIINRFVSSNSNPKPELQIYRLDHRFMDDVVKSKGEMKCYRNSMYMEFPEVDRQVLNVCKY